MLGFGTKAGLAPMHAWLPDAHSQAPAPVSALMSGVLLSVAFTAILRYKILTDAVLGPGYMRTLLVAAALAGKIVAAMQAPFELDGIVVSISASIGLTFYSDEELSPAELLNRADVLLYEAKQAGRNTFRAGPALAPARSDAA